MQNLFIQMHLGSFKLICNKSKMSVYKYFFRYLIYQAFQLKKLSESKFVKFAQIYKAK